MLQTGGKLKYAAILFVTAMLALSACGSKPLHTSKWQDDGDEMRPGPSLFSGEDGEFVITPE